MNRLLISMYVLFPLTSFCVMDEDLPAHLRGNTCAPHAGLIHNQTLKPSAARKPPVIIDPTQSPVRHTK